MTGKTIAAILGVIALIIIIVLIAGSNKKALSPEDQALLDQQTMLEEARDNEDNSFEISGEVDSETVVMPPTTTNPETPSFPQTGFPES